MERETGIEPATSSLGSWRSTAELLPLRPANQASLSPRRRAHNQSWAHSREAGPMGAIAANASSPLRFRLWAVTHYWLFNVLLRGLESPSLPVCAE